MMDKDTCPFCGAPFDQQIAEGRYWTCGTSQWGRNPVRQWQCYRNEAENLSAALWEIVELLDKHEYYGFRPEEILKKHHVPIPEGKEVW